MSFLSHVLHEALQPLPVLSWPGMAGWSLETRPHLAPLQGAVSQDQGQLRCCGHSLHLLQGNTSAGSRATH